MSVCMPVNMYVCMYVFLYVRMSVCNGRASGWVTTNFVSSHVGLVAVFPNPIYIYIYIYIHMGSMLVYYLFL